MKRVLIYNTGNWTGINEQGIEVYGEIDKNLLNKISEIVNNEDDETTKKIKEAEQVKEEAKKKVNRLNEEKIEMLQPIRTLLKIADDEIVLENSKYLESYEVDKEYKTNDLFKLESKVFRVIQDHTSQDDWKPERTPALYQDLSNVLDEEGNEVISEWKQPIGGHDLYCKGDKVIYDNRTWELVGNDTGHAPGLVYGIWEVI